MKGLIWPAWALALLFAPLTAAHHGWDWTSGENLELSGTIKAVRLGYPHGELDLDVEGTQWTVEVGQPHRNDAAGIAAGALAEGVKLKVSGEPAADPAKKLLKAERLWLDGQMHDLYPERD